MKTRFGRSSFRQIFWSAFALLTLILSFGDRAYAGFNLEMDVIRYHQYGYYFSPNLTTNGVQDLAYGDYFITSYGWPTNGSSALYQFDSTGFYQIPGGFPYGFGDYDSMMHELTNGTWFIYVTNTVTTNVYHFTVKAFITSNDLPYVDITYPVDGSTNVPNQVTFTWQGGPTNYSDLIAYQGGNSSFLPITATSWTAPAMSDGMNNFTPHYYSNSTTAVISSQPVDNGSHPISSWASSDQLQDYSMSQFSVGVLDTSGTAHTLIAHYPFDSTSSSVLDGGTDTSGNGYDMSFAAGYGTGGGANLTSDSEAGSGAVQFNDSDGSSGGVLGWSEPTPPALLTALAGSFTVSCWIKTTQNNFGWDSAPAYYGAGIVSADVGGLANDTVPIALTGNKIGFNTGGSEDDTLNSQASVNDGNYHHIVVTRNQQTGEKIIYIDGVFDSFSSGTTNLLNDPQTILIGALGDAGNPDPDYIGFYNGYNGELDDLQIYSGVLSSNEVATLFNNPGATVPNGGGGNNFNSALGTSGFDWSTSGDSDWYVENSYTYSNETAAAQSGAVVDYQSSTLSITVTGPGFLSFAWASQADPNGNFDYEFSIDGNDTDDLYGQTPWHQETDPGSGNSYFYIPAGAHNLSWTTFADGDEEPAEAGYLDNVSYVLETAPVVTLDPFNQTNYPGYPVWLDANVTSSSTNAPYTWQWYKVGVGPIPGANNSYFIPTNSGTAGVAGSYYAVVSDDAGSVFTTTAMVAFVSAPLPPNWSIAFKSPFEPEDDSQNTSDYYYGCFADTNGNIYAAAEFSGNMQVGALNLNSGTGGGAAAIVKQSATGSPLWAVGITNGNGSSSAYAVDVAPAPGGGAYLNGNYNGNNWLGTNELTDNGNGNIFLARFDANGSNLWVDTFGGTNADFVIINSLASDPAGNVTLTGLLGGGPVTIGSSNYMVNGQEGIILQADPVGAVRWSQLLPSEWAQYATYSAGRLYFSVNPTLSGGTTNVIIGGVSNIINNSWVVACLNDTNGQAIWVRGVGTLYGAGNNNPYGSGLIDDVPRLAISGTNVLMTAVAYGPSASFGNITVNLPDLRDQYFARYDTNGNAIVATAYGSVTTTPIAAVANAQGDLYVSGDFDTYSFFGNPLIAAPVATRPYTGDFSEGFVAKFDINGNPLWADEAISSANVNFLGIALATNGVWASGWGQSGQYPAIEPIQFGTNNVYSDGQYLTGGEGGGVAVIWHQAGVLGKVTESAATASPVTMINPQLSGTNFQFQFVSEASFSHNILYTTNLQAGIWKTNTTVNGDGTLKTIEIPMSLFAPSRQGFVKVTTQ